MGGKAWMEGLVPYVDFADSKGPLLWLIYGLGYLISPRSFIGLYILEILSYWATFCLIYRSALIITGRRESAGLVVALMPIAYFFPVVHNEMRAEDFCNLLYALTLYGTLKIAMEKGSFIKYGIYGGISVGCGLLIKYNVGFLLAIPPLGLLLWKTLRPKDFKDSLWSLTSAYSAGFLIAVVPILLCFLQYGNLGAFLDEYFVNTFSTLRNLGVESEPVAGLSSVSLHLGLLNLRGLYIAVSCMAACCIFFIPILPLGMRWLVAAWFIMAAAVTVIMPWDYYLFNLAVFWVFLFSALSCRVGKIGLSVSAIAGACAVGIVGISSTSVFTNGEFYRVDVARMQHEAERDFSALARSRGEEHGRPVTIAYANMPDIGLHIGEGLLPGVKYWALQSGASDAMAEQHIRSILEEMPDFVVVRHDDTSMSRQLETRGYVLALSCEATGPDKSNLEEINIYESPQPLKRGIAR